MKYFSLCLFTILFAASVLFAQETKKFEETFSVDRDGTLSIETYKGSINVEVWDKSEVYFKAIIEPDTDGWSTSPKEQLERCTVEFGKSGNSIFLKSDYKKKLIDAINTLAFVHYTVKVPADFKIVVDDYKSESKLYGLNSQIDFETYKGEVKIYDFSGSIDLETYKGEIKIDFTDIKGNCSFDTYKGDIELSIPSDEKFSVDFDLGRKGDYSGDFDIELSRFDRKSREVYGNVNGGGDVIYFETYKGEIKLKRK